MITDSGRSWRFSFVCVIPAACIGRRTWQTWIEAWLIRKVGSTALSQVWFKISFVCLPIPGTKYVLVCIKHLHM